MMLVVEHLVDWARTEYRTNILQSLEALGAPMQGTSLRDTASAHRDTARIASPRQAPDEASAIDDNIRNSAFRLKAEKDIKVESVEQPLNIPTLMDNNSGRKRILFQQHTLLIQRPIIKTTLQRVFLWDISLLRSFDKSKHKILSSMWNILQYSIKLTIEELYALERLWLGGENYSQFFVERVASRNFQVVFVVSFNIDHNGQAVRALRYLAFPTWSKEAAYSECTRRSRLNSWKDALSTDILDMITTITQGSTRSIIRVCLAEKSILVHPTLFPEGCSSYYENQEPIFEHSILRHTTDIIQLLDSFSSDIVPSTILFNQVDDFKHSARVANAIEDTAVARNAILDTLVPPIDEYGRPFIQTPAVFQPLFNVFLFRDTVYDESFKFEDFLSFTPERFWERVINGLRELRRCFPDVTDAERCRILVESKGQVYTKINDEGEDQSE